MDELVLTVGVYGEQDVACGDLHAQFLSQDHTGPLVRGCPRRLGNRNDGLVGESPDESGSVGDNVLPETAGDHILRSNARVASLSADDLEELPVRLPRIQDPACLAGPVRESRQSQHESGADARLLHHVVVSGAAFQDLHALPRLQNRSDGGSQWLFRIRDGAFDPDPELIAQVHEVAGV